MTSAQAAPRDFVPRVVGGGVKLQERVARSRDAFKRSAEVGRLRTAHPAEPWRWDHAWDERGARDDDTTRRATHSFAVAIVFSLFAVPATVIGVSALVAADTVLQVFAVPFVAIALVFDVVVGRLFVHSARLMIRRLKHGPPVAVFDGFPFRRGQRLRIHVAAPPTLPQHALATATLRCVQERYVTTSTAEDSTTLHCFEVYRDTAPVELVDAGPGVRALRVTFPIPADAPATDLASHPCRYWEVDVEASIDGIDYGARFLVPVY
jgi:hypothetical protein